MLLAGDIGGTKTFLGLFEPTSPRPRDVATRAFITLEHADLTAIVTEFVEGTAAALDSIEGACFGVAGPVIDHAAELTNVPWVVDARQLASRFGLRRVDLLNDLQAMAYGLTVLDESEVHVLQQGHPVPHGSIGLIAAGTGLGIASLHRIDGRYVPTPSEGGHADFAARNEREIGLLRWLTERTGRAEVEDVVSGRGVLNIYRVTHDTACAFVDLASRDAAAQMTTAGLERRCERCAEALEMFVESYGAEAGNLALRTVSTGGMFIGGGIAPKILPAISDGRFMRAFRSKPPFEALLSMMPVKIIINPQTALLGAAVYAMRQQP